MSDMDDSVYLRAELKLALGHLYDLAFLSKSPLLQELGLTEEKRPAHALQDALIGAIEELKPPADAPIEAHRTYLALHYRYVQGLDKKAVAHQLDLGERQTGRVLRAALDSLCACLHGTRERPTVAESRAENASAISASTLAADELDWLRRSFRDELRQALSHLYDPNFLSQSPLIHLLGLSCKEKPPLALRDTLIQAIQALEPPPDAPLGAQRKYQSLDYHYIQGLVQGTVARQLGLGPRQTARVLRGALDALAAYLRDQATALRGATQKNEMRIALSQDAGKSLQEELAWLQESFRNKASDITSVVEDILQLLGDFTAEKQVILRLAITDCHSSVQVPRTVLRQVVLSLITPAIRAASGGTVTISLTNHESSVTLVVEAAPAADQAGGTLESNEAGDMCQRLAQLYGGSVSRIVRENGTITALHLPSANRIVVAAVEDNTDTLELWRRYLAQSRFQLLPISDATQALERIVDNQPHIVLLDVMMPRVDGWELLTQLRTHPATSGIPVIVCTVLPQREFALSLGASDFVRKPSSRQEFLETLQGQIEALEPAPMLPPFAPDRALTGPSGA